MKFETTIQNVIERTPNVVSLRFPRPSNLEYKPGQYLFVTLNKDGKEVSRPFSFSSSPTEPNLIEFTKKLSESDFSAALRTAKIGDWARIDAPYGKFTFEGEYPKIALLGGGIGITPFISMCKYATDKGLNSKIVLFYGCRNPSDIVFKSEFEELATQNRNLQVAFIVSQATPDWKGSTGRIDANIVKRMLPDLNEYIFYTCGPPPMVKAMQDLIENLGLPKEKLKLEYFAGYAQP
jgi:glycine betaine catabolism B